MIFQRHVNIPTLAVTFSLQLLRFGSSGVTKNKRFIVDLLDQVNIKEYEKKNRKLFCVRIGHL